MKARALALRLGVMVALVLWLGHRFDLQAVLREWRGSGPETVVVAAVAFCGAMGARVARWSLQARAMGWPTGAATSRAYLWGVLAGILTPMRAGEAWRLGVLGLQGAAAWVRGASAIAYEKVLEIVSLVGIVLVGAAMLRAPAGVLVFLGVSVGLGGVATLTGLRGPSWSRASPRLAAVWSARDDLPVGARWTLLGLTVTSHLLNYAGITLLYRGFGDVALGRLFVGLPVVTLAAAAPITLSGIGLREAVAAEVLGGAGVSPAAAAVCASLGFVGANVFPSIFCLFLLTILEIVQRRETPSASTASEGACDPSESSSSAPTATSAGL